MAVFVKLYVMVFLCVLDDFGATLDKEALWPVPKLVKAAGYPVEKHRVYTEDGYILQIHRIPAGRRVARRSDDSGGKGKKAVLLVHGMMGSSGDFIIMGPERSLGYFLADAGYDVWLGNLRGTMYSSHSTLQKNNPEFWEFSIQEHGMYDVPAIIDKVLNVTALDKIMYVGYSMGTTSFFTMLSEKPEYNDKLIAFIGLAPAVYLDNLRSLASLLLESVHLSTILRERGIVVIQTELLRNLISNLCILKNIKEDLCVNFVSAIVGEDYEQNDLEMLPIYLNRVQPVTARQLEHFGKIALTGKFIKFGENISTPSPPYRLTNVRIPVSLLYGENDQLVEKSQVLRLAKDLKSIGVLDSVRPGCSWPKFNHIDFVFAKDVGVLLNKPLVRHIDEMYIKYAPV